MSHLLDTSAILAHYLDEPGAEQVDEILSNGPSGAWLAAPTWAEFDRRLTDLLAEPEEAARVFQHYTQTLCGFAEVNEKVVRAAIHLRRVAGQRLPLVDALIAGCAVSRDLILVHRDPHLDSVGATYLKSLRLPEKR